MALGCQQEPPPPPPPPENLPPPEPSPEQHYANMKSALAQIFAEGPISLEAGAAAAGTMTGLKSQMSATDNGRAALGMLQKDVEEGIKSNREGKRYRKVKAFCDVYKVLQPGSDRYAKVEREAEMMLAKPEVSVTGFVQSGSEIYVFCEVTDPVSGSKETFKIREGEEFYKPEKIGQEPNKSEVLRLVRIVGNQQAVEVEYKVANFVWEVPGPRTR